MNNQKKENKNIMVAIDIINPFNKTVKMHGLEKLIKRINALNVYDKVGEQFYELERCIDYSITPNTDYVVGWLNHLDSLKNTKKIIGFTLDLSK